MRALRVGVVLNGNLVEERLFGDGVPITIGQSLRCRLSVPVEGVPFEQVLFAVDHGRWLLDGKPLEHGAKGKLRIGEAVILYQELPAPPKAPRPQLPASIKGSLADRIDRRTALIVGVSLFVHIGIATWANLTDGEVDRGSWQPNAKYVPVQQDDAIEVEAGQLPAVATPVSPVQTPVPIVTRPTRITTRPDRPLTVEDADRYAAMLTGNAPGSDGRHEMQPRRVGADLRNEIDDITRNGRNVKVGNEGGTREGGARRGTGRGLELDSQGDLDHMTKADEQPVLTPVPEPGPKKKRGTLTMEMVLAKIQGAYLVGLQRCYKRVLTHDSWANGKVKLAFTVDERGHTTDLEAHGVTPELDACIAAQMAGWLFPIPRDETGEPAEAGFTLSLAFQRAD